MRETMDSLILLAKGIQLDGEKRDRPIRLVKEMRETMDSLVLLVDPMQIDVDIPSLPTEVLYEIFIRLPSFKPVHKFRCVSKLWNSLLSDPSFINQISKILIGKIPWIVMYDPSDLQIQLYQNQDTHKFINRRDGGLSFDFLLDIKPFNKQKLQNICILDSCSNGLVLYSPYHVHYDKLHLTDINYNTYLCICNPLTKQWVSLPPRPHNVKKGGYHFCTKLVCESSLVQYSLSNYKVVYIYSDVGNNLTFQMFSFDTGKWKTLPSFRELRTQRPREWYSCFKEMFIRDGVFYWTAEVSQTTECILLCYNSLENNENGRDRCRSMALPMIGVDKDDERWYYDRKFFHTFFGESEWCIFYCGQIEQTTDYKAFLSVWMIDQHDYANGGLFTWKIVHNNIELEGYRSSKIEAISIDPVDRNIIIIVEDRCCLAYNITTLTHEMLHGCPIPETETRKRKLQPILITPKPTVIPPLFK